MPRLEAQVLAAYAFGKSRSWISTHDDIPLTAKKRKFLDKLLLRLIAEEPLPYITGMQEFFGYPFRVNPNVLIPRPETEQLVEITLQWLAAHPHCRTGIDIGTGSGCIAISLCRQIKDLHITAVDISATTLEIARQNAQLNEVCHQLTFELANLLPESVPKIDFLCANLPYIPSSELDTLKVAQHEPVGALDGGENGFTLIEELLIHLQYNPPAFMIFEMDISHAKLATSFCEGVYPHSRINIVQDLAGHDRYLIIETV